MRSNCYFHWLLAIIIAVKWNAWVDLKHFRLLESHGSGESAFDAPREVGFSADSRFSQFSRWKHRDHWISPENSLNSQFNSWNLQFKPFFPLPRCLTITHTIGKRRHHLADDSFESHKALDYNNDVVRFIATQASSRLLREYFSVVPSRSRRCLFIDGVRRVTVFDAPALRWCWGTRETC